MSRAKAIIGDIRQCTTLDELNCVSNAVWRFANGLKKEELTSILKAGKTKRKQLEAVIQIEHKTGKSTIENTLL